MSFLSDSRELVDAWTGESDVSPKILTELRAQTETFCAATTLAFQTGSLIDLLSGIWNIRSDRAYPERLMAWINLLEKDTDLRLRFQQAIQSTLGSLDSVSFFAESGQPAQHALFREITGRLFQHFLPAPLPGLRHCPDFPGNFSFGARCAAFSRS